MSISCHSTVSCTTLSKIKFVESAMLSIIYMIFIMSIWESHCQSNKCISILWSSLVNCYNYVLVNQSKRKNQTKQQEKKTKPIRISWNTHSVCVIYEEKIFISEGRISDKLVERQALSRDDPKYKLVYFISMEINFTEKEKARVTHSGSSGLFLIFRYRSHNGWWWCGWWWWWWWWWQWLQWTHWFMILSSCMNITYRSPVYMKMIASLSIYCCRIYWNMKLYRVYTVKYKLCDTPMMAVKCIFWHNDNI